MLTVGMNELVQDLTSALEESELRIEVDEESLSGDSLQTRKFRKYHTDEVDYTSTKRNVLRLMSQHRTGSGRKQTCRINNGNLTGSDTESGFALPVIRKHRRRKIKHMETESSNISECSINKKQHAKKLLKKMELDILSPIKGCNELKCKIEEESEISESEESNDDGTSQDGDDEMTDFYNDVVEGPVSGIPSVNPWWEEDSVDDSRLKTIINGALPNMSEAAQRGFHARINRLPGMAARSIRKGRRRLKYKKGNDRAVCNGSHHREARSLEKHLLPNAAALLQPAIPDSNRGHQMLVGMGWRPGDGLGVTSQGQVLPVTLSRRLGRRGLGL